MSQTAPSEGLGRWTPVFFFLAISLGRIVLLPLAPISYVVDEASWGEAGHSIWVSGEAWSGGFRFPFLYPAILSPLYGPLPYHLAYPAAKAVNVLLVTAAIFPIWRLGRSLLGDRLALGVAVLSVAGVPGTYSAVVMPESLFFLLFWLYLAEFRGLLEPTLRSGLVTGVLATGLVATKPQAVPAIGVTVAALILAIVIQRKLVRRNWAAWSAAAVVFLLGCFAVRSLNGGSLFGSYGQFAEAARDVAVPFRELIERMAAHIAVACLGVGFAPFVAVPLLFRARFWRGASFPDRLVLAVLLVLAVTYLFLVCYFEGVTALDRVHERYLFFCYPALLILAVAVWARQPGRISILASIGVASVVGALLLVGLRLSPASYVVELAESPSRAALWSGAIGRDTGSLSFGTVVATAVFGSAVALATARSARSWQRFWLAAAPIALLGGLVTLAQIKWTSGWASEAFVRARAESVAIPRGVPVVVVSDGSPAAFLRFEAVRHAGRVQIVSLAEATVEGAAGILNVPLIEEAVEPYWVTPRQIRLRGEVVYRGPDFQIYGPAANRRLLAQISGVVGGVASGRVEVLYYPADVFLDEVNLVMVLSSAGERRDREALRIDVEGAEGGHEGWWLDKTGSPYDMPVRREDGGGFRLALIPLGCGATDEGGRLCFSMKELLVRDVTDGRIIDVLWP